MVKTKKKIFRIAISEKRGGMITGFKLVEGTSAKKILQSPKSKFVGTGRFVVGVFPTKLRGTLKSRRKIPRSKRFGKEFG